MEQKKTVAHRMAQNDWGDCLGWGEKKTDLENTDVIIMTQTRVIDSNVTITDVLCVQNGALCNSMASRTLRADEAINQIEKINRRFFVFALAIIR